MKHSDEGISWSGDRSFFLTSSKMLLLCCVVKVKVCQGEMFYKQKHLGMEEAMQHLSRSKMFHTAAFPFSWGKIYIAVVGDKISPQSQAWQASICISILC